MPDKVIVHIEEILRLKERLYEINRLDVNNIDFRENDIPLEINQETKDEFVYLGLNTSDFISSKFYLSNMFYEEDIIVEIKTQKEFTIVSTQTKSEKSYPEGETYYRFRSNDKENVVLSMSKSKTEELFSKLSTER